LLYDFGSNLAKHFEFEKFGGGECYSAPVNHGWAARGMGAGEPPRPSDIFQAGPRPSSISPEARVLLGGCFRRPIKPALSSCFFFFLYFAIAVA
jgi:hypothetical protein